MPLNSEYLKNMKARLVWGLLGFILPEAEDLPATFQPDGASHECVVASTLKRVGFMQGELWLDWEFWK
jgi:hypothetical protein